MPPVPPVSVVETARRVSAGEARAVDVADQALARIEAYERVQPEVWIARFTASELSARAQVIDARVARGEALPLAGVPFAVKDNIDLEGLATTAGCPAFAYRPARSAEVVRRLVAAGALPVGKTNLDQFATGLVGSRSPYGACRAAHNRDYISGGSSAGSAVALAADLVGFSLGTDTAGSGRVPAALNGLYGLKPTKGRWSTTGVVPACRSLDCVSLFTRFAADAALIDDVLVGFDASDPYSRRAPTHDARSGVGFRFGVASPEQRNSLGDKASEGLFDAAVLRFERMGGTAVIIDIQPLLEAAKLLYQGPWVAERTAAFEDLLLTAPQVIHPVVRSILQGGLSISAIEVFRAEYALKAFQRAAEQIWDLVDVVLLPTAPTTYRLREVLAEPLALNANLGRYTNFVNLLDMSALSVPAGFRDNATGFGVTLIGPAFADATLLHLAQRYEEIAPMPPSPALDVDGVPERVELCVVGAHLAAMPLHWQLTSRDATLVRRCRTAAAYKLYAMADTSPPKPALVHVGAGGEAIEVEIYALDVAAFGSFVVEVPAPLAIGTVTLDDGTEVKGFVAEPRAILGARDITAMGGWRAYVASLAKA